MNQGKTLQKNAVLLQLWVSQAVPLSYGDVVFAGSVPFPAGGGQAVLCLVGSGLQHSSGVCHYVDSLVLFTDFTVNPDWTIRLQGEKGHVLTLLLFLIDQ